MAMPELTEVETKIYVISLEKDLEYYTSGLDVLLELKQAEDNIEFEQLLEKNHCDPNWTMDDVNNSYNDTKTIIGVIKKLLAYYGNDI